MGKVFLRPVPASPEERPEIDEKSKSFAALAYRVSGVVLTTIPTAGSTQEA